MRPTLRRVPRAVIARLSGTCDLAPLDQCAVELPSPSQVQRPHASRGSAGLKPAFSNVSARRARIACASSSAGRLRCSVVIIASARSPRRARRRCRESAGMSCAAFRTGTPKALLSTKSSSAAGRGAKPKAFGAATAPVRSLARWRRNSRHFRATDRADGARPGKGALRSMINLVRSRKHDDDRHDDEADAVEIAGVFQHGSDDARGRDEAAEGLAVGTWSAKVDGAKALSSASRMALIWLAPTINSSLAST